MHTETHIEWKIEYYAARINDASTLADQQAALTKMLEWKKMRSAEIVNRLDEERLNRIKKGAMHVQTA